jgi:CHAT domain-containing protein/Tfp pilus assembly protein PilF
MREIRISFRFFFLIFLFSARFLSALEQTLTTSEEFTKAILAAQSKEEQDTIVKANQAVITPEWVTALFDKGEENRNKGEYERALEIFDAVYRTAEKLGYKKEMARALDRSGFVLHAQARYEEATSLIQRAITIAETLNDKAVLAACYTSLGLIHGNQGNYELGLQFMQKSLKLSEEIGDEKHLSVALNNTAYLLFSLGDYEGALEKVKRVETILGKSNDTAKRSSVLHNMGALYQQLGNHRLALDYYQQSLELGNAADNKPGVALMLGNIGIIYLDQGYYELALDYTRQSLELFQNLGEKRHIAHATNTTAVIHFKMGQLDQALEGFKKGLKIAEEISDKDGIGHGWDALGEVYRAQGKLESAMNAFNKSLIVHQEIKDKEGTALAMVNLGSMYFKKGNYEKALELGQQAAEISVGFGKRELLGLTMTEIGMAYWKLGKFVEARQSFDKAIDEVEALRLMTFGGELETKGFFETRLKPYYSAVLLHIDQQKPVEAFLYAERARSRTLLNVLQDGRPDLSKAMSPAEQDEEKKWNHRLQSLNTMLLQAKQKEPVDPQKVSGLTTQLEKARLDYESFRSKLYIVHPTLKNLQGESDPLKFSEVESLIDKDTAIVEYIVTEESAHGFVITSAGSGQPNIHSFPITITREKLSKEVKAFREKIASRNLLFQDEARKFHKLLIQPASQYLNGKTKLIVVPDHSLWELPFQVLLAASSRYLIEDYSISYVPSITVLREMKGLHQEMGASQTLLALGNPDIGNEMVQKMNSLYRDTQLGPLAEAEREVKQLGELYGRNRSSVLIGAEAEEEQIKHKSEEYRILHFATHGVFDNASPLYSYLVFAKSKDSSEDGLLEAREIMNLNFGAQLAVLSACETARGTVGNGEGVIGLSWALFVAGVPGIVVSQWKVDSASTTELMVAFHTNLIKGMSPAVALQKAELQLLRSKNFRHPFYWAGFVPIGHTN